MEDEPSSDEETGSDSDIEGGREGHGQGSFRKYMAELDEQLEKTLDGAASTEGVAAEAGVEQPPGRRDNNLPLSSHHVKVHDAEPLELDVHAMEHLLASFCSEQRLEPGPASLLMRELGLAGGRNSAAASANSVLGAAPVVAGSALDGMD